MSMPKFPDIPEGYSCETAIAQILTSIAMEEIGLSHILNAEGEKLQYVLGTLEGSRPAVPPTIDQILEVNESVKDMLIQVAVNQESLSKKMTHAMDAYLECKKDDHGDGGGSGEDCGDPPKPPTDPDRTVTLAQPNKYHPIEKGTIYEPIISGAYHVTTSNKKIATAEVRDDKKVYVTGVGAGEVALGASSSVGLVSCIHFHVFDPEKISSYVLKNGGKVFFAEPGQTKPCPVTVTPAAAQDDIEWMSLNPSIVTVTANGNLKSVSKGTAAVVGTFTDTWGLPREITLIIGVGVQM